MNCSVNLMIWELFSGIHFSAWFQIRVIRKRASCKILEVEMKLWALVFNDPFMDRIMTDKHGLDLPSSASCPVLLLDYRLYWLHIHLEVQYQHRTSHRPLHKLPSRGPTSMARHTWLLRFSYKLQLVYLYQGFRRAGL